ncbi:MAG: heavy metal-responsive transcriptional regulator [Pyrinomonadaceae bacterium]|nr:heavy metal-responsive transcriptional regulator [Pyrinomonadaceae bacterium]
MVSSELRIGEVAARSDVSIDTVRYYERLRLLPRAPRTGGGFRLFPQETIERVHFIRQAQEMGLSLEEIGQLLATRGGVGECRNVSDLLRAKLAGLDERMKKMRDFRRTLSRHLAACECELTDHGEEAACPVMEELGHLPKVAGSAEKKKK